MIRALAVAAVLAFSTASGAAVFEPREFDSAAHEESYRKLIEELRCLVCQNQNVADSDADLAADLRREVYEQLHSGASEAEILDYMTARYGDFVLYRPPVKGTTIVLWAGPFVLVLLGAGILFARLSARRAPAGATAEPSLDDSARERLRALTGVDRDS